MAKLGIGRTFQLNPLFPEFTVLENVTSSFDLHPHSSLVDIFFNTPKYRRNEKFIEEMAHEILEIVGLSKEANELARNLAHGHQKMLGVARALATKPTMLLLDEPLAGMNPSEIQYSLDAIRGHARQRHHRAHRRAQHADPEPVRPGGRDQLRPEDLRGPAAKRSGPTRRSSPPTLELTMFVEIKDVSVYYHKSLAIKDVTVNVPEGGVVTIIGANGAGKSTILKSLVGLVPIQDGPDLLRRPGHAAAWTRPRG